MTIKRISKIFEAMFELTHEQFRQFPQQFCDFIIEHEFIIDHTATRALHTACFWVKFFYVPGFRCKWLPPTVNCLMLSSLQYIFSMPCLLTCFKLLITTNSLKTIFLAKWHKWRSAELQPAVSIELGKLLANTG